MFIFINLIFIIMKFTVTTTKANPNTVVNVSETDPSKGWVLIKEINPVIRYGQEFDNARYALFRGPLERLNAMQGLVKGADFEALMKARGYAGLKIITTDSLTKTYDNQKPRKMSDKKGGQPILSVDGQFIYRTLTISDVSDTTEDTIIPVQRIAVVKTATVSAVEATVENDPA